MHKNSASQKFPQLKLAVAKKIKDFVTGGGFIFAMCSATDSYDIALLPKALTSAKVCSMEILPIRHEQKT